MTVYAYDELSTAITFSVAENPNFVVSSHCTDRSIIFDMTFHLKLLPADSVSCSYQSASLHSEDTSEVFLKLYLHYAR